MMSLLSVISHSRDKLTSALHKSCLFLPPIPPLSTALAYDDTLLRGAGAPRGPFGARLTNHDTLLRGAGAPRGPSSAQLTNNDMLLRGAGALRDPYSDRPTYYDLPPLTTGPEGPSSTRPRQTQGVDGWGSIPVVFFPDPAGHPYRTPACKTPFPPSAAAYWKGVISVHPLCQGDKEISSGS